MISTFCLIALVNTCVLLPAEEKRIVLGVRRDYNLSAVTEWDKQILGERVFMDRPAPFRDRGLVFSARSCLWGF